MLASNKPIDHATANAISEIFFEVVIAPSYSDEALSILKSKKNRIILVQEKKSATHTQYRSLLNGVYKENDEGNYID